MSLAITIGNRLRNLNQFYCSQSQYFSHLIDWNCENYYCYDKHAITFIFNHIQFKHWYEILNSNTQLMTVPNLLDNTNELDNNYYKKHHEIAYGTPSFESNFKFFHKYLFIVLKVHFYHRLIIEFFMICCHLSCHGCVKCVWVIWIECNWISNKQMRFVSQDLFDQCLFERLICDVFVPFFIASVASSN